MKFKPVKLAPALIAICIIALVCLVRLLQLEFFDRLERMTYDLRVNAARRFPQPVATNLGAVFISDDSIRVLKNGSLGFRAGLYWPRHVYGRVLRELSVQGARAVAFDVLFAELRGDHGQVPVRGDRQTELAQFLATLYPDQTPTKYSNNGEELTLVESDDYFAWQLNRSGMTVLAAEHNVRPHPLFATNALAYGDISAERDLDGVLRRAKAFYIYTNWHAAFRQLEAAGYGVDLGKARVEPDQIILPRSNGEDIKFPLDADGNFDLSDIGTPPAGTPPKAKPFTIERVWHMGIVLAARQLDLDLTNAEILPNRSEIILRGSNGLQRVLPVDRDDYFYINWELTAFDTRLTRAWFEQLIVQDQARSVGQTQEVQNIWKDRLVVVGSIATGNDLTDRGATPLEKDTFLVSKHWNVANSVITGRFVHRASLGMELATISLLGLLAALLTWFLPPLRASASVFFVAVGFVALGFYLYIQHRYWLPMVLPVLGALLMEHICLVTWRVVFEQGERRRVKSVFSRIVAPEVVNELLGAEKLSLGGARCEATILFADVRGFTELTDMTQERAAEYVREHKLTGEAAEVYFDEVARDILNTVNTYLALVADMVKKHGGTLDKYIGDCVMAFWGAPTANPQHALACVRAAIDAQQGMFELNRQRAGENKQREIENRELVLKGLQPKSLLPTLSLGTGINTGLVTVGLMGSEAHILNYTVFGREVNVASRLEHESGRGRIVISEATFEHLRRDDPALAANCKPLEAVTVKGIRTAVKIYEVPWQKI